MKPYFLLLLAAAAVLSAPASRAQYLIDPFNAPDTASAEWEYFTTATGPNDAQSAVLNGVDVTGTNAGNFNTYDSSGASFITSGGNIYSFASALNINVESTLSSFTPNNVLLQIRTLGREYDPTSIFLVGTVDGVNDIMIAPDFVFESDRQGDLFIPPAPGLEPTISYEVITAFQWDLEDLGDANFSLLDNANFSIVFDALSSSMSLDVVQLDLAGGNVAFEQVIAIPEPASGTLILAGLGALAWARRRTTV